MSFLKDLRQEFPALSQKINGYPLVYLDSAATALKPRRVIDLMSRFYLGDSANVHRGSHTLSNRSTAAYEEARAKVAEFLSADASEVIFLRGTTEAINLISSTLGEFIKDSGEILLSELEHHANIIPWQQLAYRRGHKLRFIPIRSDGELDLQEAERLINQQTKVLAITGCSNTLGTLPNLQRLIQKAQAVGAYTVGDAAQLVAFERVDVKKLGCDFLAFSGHKLFAPTGIGVLYGRKDLMDQLPPWQTGGSMISRVTFEKSEFLLSPQRFEAGTPNIGGAIALGAAIDFLNELDTEEVKKHEIYLRSLARKELSHISGVVFYETLEKFGPILSFNLEGAHHSDVAQILDQQGVAVRSGHHCTQPLMSKLGVLGTVRASFSIYNSAEDVESLVSAVKKAKELLL
ncbi:MAG: SufS family cysteine desulfurase [Bdellovibrionaceae bacterium]|nr:SufS family cysteine desulfurase [Pseudobdellovibrionaceae bacterium]